MINHIAIILDGNRRYAKKNNITLVKSYDMGIKNMKSIFEYCEKNNIKFISYYCCSIDNLVNRTEQELDIIFSLFNRELDILMNSHENRKYRFIVTDENKIPLEYLQKMRDIEKVTSNNMNQVVNIYFSYGSREAIIKSTQKILNEKKILTDSELIKEMNSSLLNDGIIIPDPELIIRTSGETRLSNYLLFEAKYSEIIFIDEYWPEFTIELLEDIINHDKNKKKNFGK